MGGRVRPVLDGEGPNDFAEIPLDMGAQFMFSTVPNLQNFLLYSTPTFDFTAAPDFIADSYFCFEDFEDQCELKEEDVQIGGERFKDNSYFSYLDTYVIPKIPTSNIMTNSIVTKIDYSNTDHITLDISNEQTSTTSTLDCSILLLATGANVLQPGNPDAITFEPSLDSVYSEYLDAFNNVRLQKGFRAWFEFSTAELYQNRDILSTVEWDFNNAVFGQTSAKNILTIEVNNNNGVEPFAGKTNDEIKNDLLASLDTALNGTATSNLLK